MTTKVSEISPIKQAPKINLSTDGLSCNSSGSISPTSSAHSYSFSANSSTNPSTPNRNTKSSVYNSPLKKISFNENNMKRNDASTIPRLLESNETSTFDKSNKLFQYLFSKLCKNENVETVDLQKNNFYDANLIMSSIYNEKNLPLILSHLRN
jgi:hypothetical protein